MNEEQLKEYYEFWNETWKFIRKYSTGITDTNVWQAVPEADELKAKHSACIGRKKIVDDVVLSLKQIGEKNNPDSRDPDRANAFFNRAMEEEHATQTMWNVVAVWMSWYTAYVPEMEDYVIGRLHALLFKHGHHIGQDELKDYAQAGWCIALKQKEGD